MAKIMYDTGNWTSDESWRSIRNLRSSKPRSLDRHLKRDGRAGVFHMALEQSEQLFRAAAEVPTDSRPILLFYGLSQAGRALAAASTQLEDRHWSATNHGLVSQTETVDPNDVWSLKTRVSQGENGLFRRVSTTLMSPIDQGTVELGATAANILEFTYEYQDFDRFPWAFQSPKKSLRPKPDLDNSTMHEMPLDIEIDVDSNGRLTTETPALAGLALATHDDGTLRRDQNGHLLVQIPEDRTVRDDWNAYPQGMQRYRGVKVLTRSLGATTAATHPLMIWWLTLFPLSVLARYEPQKWQHMINLQASSSASQLEYLCHRALDTVPELLARVLQDVTSPSA